MTKSAPEKSAPLPSRTNVLDAEIPSEIRVGKGGASLTLSWPDGGSSCFPAPFLRENSQSAGSKKLRLSGLSVPAPRDLTIRDVRPIGAYAINIVFSDGYDRGIYPWIYLRQLDGTAAPEQPVRALKAEDFLKSN